MSEQAAATSRKIKAAADILRGVPFKTPTTVKVERKNGTVVGKDGAGNFLFTMSEEVYEQLRR